MILLTKTSSSPPYGTDDKSETDDTDVDDTRMTLSDELCMKLDLGSHMSCCVTNTVIYDS